MKIQKTLILMLVLSIFFAAACTSSNPQQPPAPQPVQENTKTGQPSTAAAQNTPSAETQKEMPSPITIHVSISGFKFSPADVIINTGDTVVWTNDDSAPHTVESADGTLKSDELSKGDTYSYTFTKPGKTGYKCGIHPTMHGSVTVQ